MDTRANYAVIGLFTIAVIVAAFGFVFWFAGTDTGPRKAQYRVIFQGSVAGLAKGAPVLFNGIRVGDVSTVNFNEAQPKEAYAIIEVQPNTPIKTDTRANLDTAILSGTAVVALAGGETDTPALTKKPGEDLPTIRAEASGLGGLLETARGTTQRANELLEQLNDVVKTNRPAIDAAIGNVKVFSDALGQNAPALNNLIAQLGTAAQQIGPLAVKLGGLTDDVDALVRSIDRQRIASIVANVDTVLRTVGDNRQQIADILQDTATLMRRLDDIAPKLDQAVGGLSQVVGAIDPARLNRVIGNVDQFAGALSNSSRNVEATARSTASLTDKLDHTADRLDGLIRSAENFLGSAAGEEGKSTFASIRGAADSLHHLTDNLDKRTADITTGLTRLTGTGSRQVDAVAGDARRAVNDIGRAARNLDRNPQSVLFGGKPSLPEYGGR